MNKQKQGFTLVELIVVITILAILGTITFISLKGYSSQSRDSARISDLSTMKTSLELFNLDAGKYPKTTDGFIVTYSGSDVWEQGTFGSNTFNSVTKLDKISTDPLTDKKYTYSTTKTKQEYQLGGLVEGDELVLLDETKAGDKEATVIVTGNYNGKVLKTLSGNLCDVLSLPSIISSQDETVTDLSVIVANEGLVYNGYKNLPSNYRTSKYNADGGFAFTSNKFVAYSDTNKCEDLYDVDDNTARITLVTNLKTAYQGTIIGGKTGIDKFVNVDLTDTNDVNLLGTTLLNNSMGGSLEIKTITGYFPILKTCIDGTTTTYLCPESNGSSRFSLVSGVVGNSGSGVILDSITGLMWQSDGITQGTNLNWINAKTFCENLSIGGFTDWRMPDISELRTIVDRNVILPSIDTNYFSCNSNDYWTSTTNNLSDNLAYDIDFYQGVEGNVIDKTSNNRYIRCVR